MRLRNWILLLAFAAGPHPATATTEYRINLPNLGEFTSPIPFREDAETSFPISNGTGTYSGHAFAGPGWVKSYGRVDAEWAGVLSGGGGGVTSARAQTDDFVISGPPGYVTGTLHWHVNATLGRGGGFVGNGAHQADLAVQGMINFVSANGYVQDTNGGVYVSGVLAGYGGPNVDAPFSITADLPVGVPLLTVSYVEAGGNTYGNIYVSPGWVAGDAGGETDGYDGLDLRLEEVGGQVMTLPAGYTLNSVSWNIVDNHLMGASDVTSDPPAPIQLDLDGANPARDGMRMTLALDEGSDAQVALFDVSGRVVQTLVDRWLGAGAHRITWDGRDERGLRAPAGSYFALANVQGHVITRRFVLLR